MGIRKPSLTVSEARRLADTRADRGGPVGPDAPNTRGLKTPAAALSSRQAPATKMATPPVKASSLKTRHSSPVVPGVQLPSAVPETKLPPLVQPRTPKIQVFISACLPAKGVSPIFEALCQQYPPQKALQMVLRRALQDYLVMLADGSFRSGPASYDEDQQAETANFVQTSRMIPQNLVVLARAHFDPLGLESTRSFGRKLASAALASFFARETWRQ